MTNDKGRGIFATKDIDQDELIIFESALAETSQDG